MLFSAKIVQQNAFCSNPRNSKFPRPTTLTRVSAVKSSFVLTESLLKFRLFSSPTKQAMTANFKLSTYLNSDRPNKI